MLFIAVQNFRSPSLIMDSPMPPAGQMVKTLGPDQARLLLSHFAAEQTRHYFRLWQRAELVLGVALAGCLVSATQKRLFPLFLCATMLVMVLFQFGITPELIYRGREADFPPGNAALGAVARVWALQQVYAGVEAVKLFAGGLLASYLFVFRTSRRSRKEVNAVGHLTR